MDSESSVTDWIVRVKQDDAAAAQRLWERYVTQLVDFARRKLHAQARRVADENDVVQEAFEAFFRAARTGQLTQLHDRHDLWRLLITITENKVHDHARHRLRARRGGGKVRGESVFEAGRGSESGLGAGLGQIADLQVDPAMAAQAVDQLRHLLDLLDPQQERITLRKMEGHSNEEIAAMEGCAPETISRKLNLIRRIWTRHMEESVV